MKHVLALLIGLLVLLTPYATAQERHNYLAVNSHMLEDSAGPYYFIAYGDSRNAYARASELADALGAKLEFNDSDKSLVFSQGEFTARLKTTADVAYGLEKRSDVLSSNGEMIDSPMGILVDGSSYVPISPVVKALGGETDWLADARVVTIYTADQLAPQVSETDDAVLGNATTAALAHPRLGDQGDRSRVAIDLPVGTNYQVAVTEQAMVVKLPGLHAAPYSLNPDVPFLKNVRFDEVEGDLALVIYPDYALSADGKGYSVGLVPANDAHPQKEIFYADFAPDLQGKPLTSITSDAVKEPQAAAKAPTNNNRTVVIDAGHGGHDSGAHSPYATEKHVVLSIALKLKALLEQQGVNVIVTRDNDHFLTLEERSEFATPERNLFISIHANSAESSQAQGVETWVFGRPLDNSLIDIAIHENGGGALGEERTQQALITADSITGEILREEQLNYSLNLAESVQQQMVAATNAKNRGVKQNVFYVIRNARTPAVLVEVGFVNNPEEGRKLATDAYQQTLANALAKGIMDFLDNGGFASVPQ